MRIETLRQRLRDHGAKLCHEQRVLRRWAQALPSQGSPGRSGDIQPQSLLAALPAIEAELQSLVRLRSEHPAEDGSAR